LVALNIGIGTTPHQKKNTMLYKDKSPHNKKNLEHGHWLLHWHNGRVMFDLHYVDGVELGIFTQYDDYGLIEKQTYYAR
jgi:antitoxin component YwqK of YwqJK toxin-antitoxin module